MWPQIIHHFPLEPLEEDVFEAMACYFPIDFTPPSHSTQTVRCAQYLNCTFFILFKEVFLLEASPDFVQDQCRFESTAYVRKEEIEGILISEHICKRKQSRRFDHGFEEVSDLPPIFRSFRPSPPTWKAGQRFGLGQTGLQPHPHQLSGGVGASPSGTIFVRAVVSL